MTLLRTRTCLLVALLSALIALADSRGASAQESEANERHDQKEAQAFEISLSYWNRRLESIESYVRDGAGSQARTDAALETLSEIRDEASASIDRTQETIEDLQERLDALGSPPGEGQPPEPGDVRRKRNQLESDLASYKSRKSLAELAQTRARSLENRLSRSERTQLFARLMQQSALPYLPDTVVTAAKDFRALALDTAEATRTWWRGLAPERRSPGRAMAILGFLAAAFLGAWWGRGVLVRRFGRHPTDEEPAYSRRLLGAVAEGLAKGFVPAALLGIVVVLARSDPAIAGSMPGQLLAVAATLAIVYVLAIALPQAVLSPEDTAWRLTRIPVQNARDIITRLRAIVLLFCLDEFLYTGIEQTPLLEGALTPALDSLWTLIFNTLQGIFVLSLLRPRLWRLDAHADSAQSRADAEADAETGTGAKTGGERPHAGPHGHLHDDFDDEADPDEEEATESGGLQGAAEAARVGAGAGFWLLLRLALAVLAVVGLLAPAAGYVHLGNYLMNNLLATGLVVGILYILRGLVREAIGFACSGAFVRDQLGLGHTTRANLKFWLRFLFDLAVLIAGVTLVAPRWGVSQGDILRWLSTAFSGFTVGSVTISVADIAFGLLAFAIVLALTGATKRTLSDRVLPETSMDEGVQHSLTAGVGYIGFVVAAALAIAVMGVDLSNLAIIAGALSVGIGFGLQNIVNNFVSGLILLIERPIKAGDWVVVAGNEGFVKQISMRATEIETWNGAAVIVPNADLLSSALTNWTHKNRYGRVDIRVGVALDCDVETVRRLLMRAARRHPRIVSWPQPMVLLMEFGESRMEFELRAFTDDIIWVMLIASELRFDILRRFREAGVAIPYAQRVIHFADGPRVVPDDPQTDPGTTMVPPATARDASGAES